MKAYKVLALVAIALAPFAANAQLQKADGNANVSKVASANASLSSLQCPFKRTVKQAALSEASSAAGSFFFASPSSLCMKYDSGDNLVIADGKVAMNLGGKQRTLNSGNHHVEDLAETLLACVQGKVASIDGTLESAKSVGQKLVFSISTDLTVARAKIVKMEVAYDASDLTLASIKLFEKDGSYQLYELSSKSINKSIDKSVFTIAARSSNRHSK